MAEELRNRGYDAGDAPEIARLFYGTVRSVNRADYSEEQVKAWAPGVPNPGEWHARMDGRKTLVATGTASAIIYGQPDGNRHPNVGALAVADEQGEFLICSGTLIAPDVFLTAAHCTAAIEQFGLEFRGVTFDDVYDPGISVVYTGAPYTHPEFPGPNSDAKDIAVVVLDEEVTGIQPALLPSLGLLDQLANDGALQGQSFTAVGYGDTERIHEPGSGAPVFGEGGTRMYSVSTFSALNKGYLRLSQNPSTGDGGVRRKNTNEFVGLCYVVQDSTESNWQLGGLTVTIQKLGIGELLVRFALAHTIVYGILLREGNWVQKIMAYVRKDNHAPRRLLTSLGFEHSGTDVFSREDAPAWMKRNRERGNIIFDEFTFTLDGLRLLATWFSDKFDGTLHPSGAEAQIELVGHNRIDHLTKALRHLADGPD